MSLRASLLSALCSLCLCGSVLANDAKEPYQIRIVVDAEKNRLLTDVFRDQIKRELHDGVQAGLGALARVEATDKHPLLAKIRAEGLDRAFAGYTAASPERTCFVLIGFSGTHYQVQTRWYDGLTGLPSPVVRTGRTRDRAYVARAAAFLMERDIGLLGTIASEPDKTQQVRVDLKGGDLGVDLARWVKKGEVFQVLRADGPGPAQPVEGAYLQVVEPARDGSCLCRLFTRYRLARAAGLRAVLLGTRSAPLRLRVLQEKPGGGAGPLSTPVTLHLRKQGFEGEESTKLQTSPIRGQVNTARDGEKGVFDRLAFVSVLTGETLRARIPVPILDGRVTVLVVPATSEEGDLILANFRAFQRGVLEAVSVQNEQFRQINTLSRDPEKRAEALARVKTSLDRSRQDYTKLTAERDEVKNELGKLDAKDRPRPLELEKIDERLALLKSGEGELQKHIALLEKIERDENDPAKKDWRIKIEGAKLLEKEAEIGKALDVYDKVPEEYRTKALNDHVAELKKRWAPKDEKHAEARRFIYEVWPGLDTPGLKERMEEAKKSFAACEAARDPYGPVKMRIALKQHFDRIEKELSELKPGVNAEDDKAAQAIKELAPELEKLDRAIQRFLEKNK
jgi:hypothetical protein